MEIQTLRERDLECDVCLRSATHCVDVDEEGGKKSRHFLCDPHLREFKEAHEPLKKPAAKGYRELSRGY